MTTTGSTTAARQTRNATEKTTGKVQQGAHEVTEKADQLFQQLPTVDLARGVERYFEFVQKAVDINRELATNWADAVNSLTGAVREQTDKAGRLLTEQTDRAGELVAEQTDRVESVTREQADKVDKSEKNQARRARQATNGHTNGHIDLHNDEHNERLIDTK